MARRVPSECRRSTPWKPSGDTDGTQAPVSESVIAHHSERINVFEISRRALRTHASPAMNNHHASSRSFWLRRSFPIPVPRVIDD